jgi:aerobic-type carbon monoxide dehydrogenase small subunit (CoxS/CutS family)
MARTSAEVGDGSAVNERALTGPGGAAAARTANGAAPSTHAQTRKKSTKKSRTIKLSVNGKTHAITAPADTMLLYVLRDELLLHGPKFGCGLAECGACAVLSNGKQIRSCVTPVGSVKSAKIVTLEGLAATYHGTRKANQGHLHPLQQAWIDKQVPQCGYCQSGMMIQAASLLNTTPRPTVAEIKTNMNGHLCRCGTYFRIVDAVLEAAREMTAPTPKAG